MNTLKHIFFELSREVLDSISFRSNRKSGQVLLITIMLLATVLTVVISLSFKGVTDTQITKLEQDSQRALAAAEAAVQAAIQANVENASVKTVTLGSGSLSDFPNSTISGGATISTTPDDEFVSPTLQQDQQYTFYLSNYTAGTGFSGTPWNDNLTLYFNSDSVCPALELTFVKTDNSLVRRLVKSTGSGCPTVNGTADSLATTYGLDFKGTTFAYKATDIVVSATRIVLVRPIGGGTKVGFLGNGTNFPIQGSVVNSEATTETGVTKKVELFQSKDQIPADFFVTSF